MQIADLIGVVLDPNLGVAWPSQIDFQLDWYVGRKWRVEYTFSSPAVPVAALSVGNEVRGVWRYEVVELGQRSSDGRPTVKLRISPERRGADGYHFVATYERPSLRLLTVERYEGALRRPFEQRPLPPLEQAVSKSPDGRTYTRTFTMQEPAAAPVTAGEGDEASGESRFEGEAEIFAGAEEIEDEG